MRRILLILIAWLLAWPAVAAAAKLPAVPPGTAYAQARSALLKQGFKPQPAPYPEPTRCDEWSRYCAAYPEFLGCYVALWTPCEFLWRAPGGGLLSVQTNMGEGAPEAPKLQVVKIEPMDVLRMRQFFRPRPKLPRFRMHTAYAQVRAGMIAAGYAPQPVERHESDEPACEDDQLCAAYPEVLHCWPTGASFCKWLFRRRSDGRFVTVLTDGEPPAMRFNGSWVSLPDELTDAFGPSARPHLTPGAR